MTIGNRVLINILILGALAASLYGYFFLRQEKQFSETQIIKRTKAFGESMREILEANLASENLAPLKKLLNRIAVFEQPMGMRVFLKTGDLFYQTKTLRNIPAGDVSNLIAQLGESDSLVEKITFQGKTVIVCSFPIESKNGSLLGILQIFDSQSVFDMERRGYQRKVFTSLMLFYTFTLAIIFFVIQRNVNRPMATLIREVQNHPSRKGGQNEMRSSGHELSILKQEFSKRETHLQEMQSVLFQSSREKEALLDQLKQSEKLAAIGKFAAGLAHEMGSPISVIEGRALQTLRKISEGPVVEKNLNLIVEQSRRLSKMINDVLLFARRRPLHKMPIDLNRVFHQALELFEEDLSKIQIHVEKQLSPLPARVEGDPDQLLQVFTNLIRNAIQAMPHGGTLTFSTSTVMENDMQLPWIRICLKDTGVGMDEDVRLRLFEPFFSRREDGQGTGLGLSIVYGIIQEHGGRIVVQSKAGEGSQFDIYLPVPTPLTLSENPKAEGASEENSKLLRLPDPREKKNLRS
ncbi:MAG: ATP-binding protein [bacterium]